MDTEVVIIGAGPYGLSVATYLQEHRVSFRIFGKPMQTWREQMPVGMHLKSEGFASTLHSPGSAGTLKEYCLKQAIPYQDLGLPVSLETFTAYGADFQARYVPELDTSQVSKVRRADSIFEITLDNGTSFNARRVIVATGLSHFEHLPAQLSQLPSELVTHSARHRDLQRFRGRKIAVLGAGASALDIAGLAADIGASVSLFSHRPTINFHRPPGRQPRPLTERLRAPMTGLGPGWRSLLCTEAPLLFRRLPQRFRLEVVKRHLGAAPGWFIKEKVVGRVPIHVSHSLRSADVHNGQVRLVFARLDGSVHTCLAEHVVAGTGFRVNIDRLPFLDAALTKNIANAAGAPTLDSFFQSSVSGLYFLGASSAATFGPMLRFVYGAGFTCRRFSAHFAKTGKRNFTRQAVTA